MYKITRILIADGHPIIRKGLHTLIVSEPDLELVGEVTEGAELIRKIRMARPDVVVLDLLLPGMDALAAIHQIKHEQPNLCILILTDAIHDKRAVTAIKAGVLGYLSKETPLDQLLQAIRDVALGRCPLDPAVAQRLVCEMKRAPDLSSTITPLNPREVEVLILVAQGLTNREIAEILILSERTVGNHISTILSKLHIGNRTQATLYALREGLAAIPEYAISSLHRNLLSVDIVNKQRLLSSHSRPSASHLPTLTNVSER